MSGTIGPVGVISAADRADGAHRIGVYGEIDPNLIDGSAIWLQAVCRLLASLRGVSIVVLLRTVPRRDVVIAELHRHPRITVVEPASGTRGVLDSSEAADALEVIDDGGKLTAVLVRGAAAVSEIAARERFAGRIWAYHVPTWDEAVERDRVRLLARAAARVLCQTEAVRRHVIAIEPALAPRIVLLPPILDVQAKPLVAAGNHTAPHLVYAGKIAPEYCFDEMQTLLARLRTRLPESELHVAGDKIHNPPEDVSFRDRAQHALVQSEGLHWHGALERRGVFDLLEQCDFGLSLRHPALDASLEISTKVLEYGAAGLPVVLNRQPRHEELLGADYPLYASDVETATTAILRAWREPALRLDAADRCREASKPFQLDRMAARLGAELLGDPMGRPGHRSPADGPPRVLVAGHQLAFFAPVWEQLQAAGWEVGEDHWSRHDTHDAARSRSLLADADVVLCEWCLGNAVWYAARRRPEQRLVVRFHRSELTTRYPAQLDIGSVDQVVFVSSHVLEEAVDRFGWPRDRLSVIPNAIDGQRFALPKVPGSETTLLVLGYVPRLKRLDKALDLLEALRFRDDRYRLLIKGTPPWEYEWMRTREHERDYYASLFSRIRESPLLGEAVLFESAGDDVPQFLQKGRFIVSTSEVEGHSVAVAEGMASGCVPVVLDRSGARDQYRAEWLFPDPRAAAHAVLELARRGALDDVGGAAVAHASTWDVRALLPAWQEMLAHPMEIQIFEG